MFTVDQPIKCKVKEEADEKVFTKSLKKKNPELSYLKPVGLRLWCIIHEKIDSKIQ